MRYFAIGTYRPHGRAKITYRISMFDGANAAWTGVAGHFVMTLEHL